MFVRIEHCAVYCLWSNSSLFAVNTKAKSGTNKWEIC